MANIVDGIGMEATLDESGVVKGVEKMRTALDAGERSMAEFYQTAAAAAAPASALGEVLEGTGQKAQKADAAFRGAGKSANVLGFGGTDAQGAIRGLGYIMNDSQQFAIGFSQGLRAVSNNIGPLIGNLQAVTAGAGGFLGGLKALRGALAGPLGVVLAFEAVSSILVIFTQKLDTAKRATDAQTSSVKALAQAAKDLVNIDLSGFEIRGSTEELAGLAVGVSSERLRISKEIAAIDRVGLAITAEQVAQRAALGSELQRVNALQDALVAKVKGGSASLAIENTARRLGIELIRKQTRELGELARELERVNAFADKNARLPEAAGPKTLAEALGRRTPLDPFATGLTPPKDQAKALADSFGDALEASSALAKQVSVGLLSPLEAAAQQTKAIGQGMLVLVQQGQQGSIEYAILAEQLRDSQVALVGLTIATEFTDAFSTGLADVLVGLESVKDAAKALRGVIQGLIRDLIAAAIRSALLMGLGAIVGGPLGVASFGSLFLSGLGISTRTAAPSGFSAQQQPIVLQGVARVSMEELSFSIQQAGARRGIA